MTDKRTQARAAESNMEKDPKDWVPAIADDAVRSGPT